LGLSWDQVGTKLGLSWDQAKKMLNLSEASITITVLMHEFGWSNRTKFRQKFINPMLELNLIAMTIPGKPKSSKQKYAITDNGKLLLKELNR
jgi:ATP-dependent DNA helicase RecG